MPNQNECDQPPLPLESVEDVDSLPSHQYPQLQFSILPIRSDLIFFDQFLSMELIESFEPFPDFFLDFDSVPSKKEKKKLTTHRTKGGQCSICQGTIRKNKNSKIKVQTHIPQKMPGEMEGDQKQLPNVPRANKMTSREGRRSDKVVTNFKYIMKKTQTYKGSPTKSIDQAIDDIIEHHYFNQKVTKLIENKTQSYLNANEHFSMNGYMVQEKELVSEFSDIICLTVEENLRKVLNEEFINVTKEVQQLKEQMYVFMEEQTKITSKMKKELEKGLEEIRRKSLTEGIVGSILPARGNSVKGMRANLKSQLENSQKKSQYGEIVEMKQQMQKLKTQLEKGQNFIAISQLFNQFKIETKITIQGLKHQMKKMMGENSNILNEKNKKINSSLKDAINDCVRRNIKGQLSVYGSYMEEMLALKAGMEKLEESIEKTQIKSNDYFSSQLRSVWVVLNDIKRTVDYVLEHLQIPTSEII